MNKFITFEGIDGCGKTTHIQLLSEYFLSKNIDNIIVREPGGTKVSEKVRSILLDDKNNINSYTETLLFLSSRSQLVHEVIKESIRKNIFILCDRFTDSTLSYQGFARGLDLEVLDTLNNFATLDIKPDITFILDIDILESINRKVNTNRDRMEQEGKEFLNKVKLGYLEIAKRDMHRYFVIDCNNKNINEINNEIINHVKNYYREIIVF